MTRTRRLMVLGGGRHQLPLIQRAEDRGIEVVLVDYLENAPARKIATHPLLLDALNADAAISAGREYAIDGVVTTGTDLPVATMAAVAAALDLPCWITPQGARTATDKFAMHAALSGAGLRRAWHQEFGADTSPDAADLPLPVVVKPSDSQGQRGVTRVKQSPELDDAVRAARRHSASNRIVVEEFLVGPEVTANAWVQDGEVVLLAVNDRVTYNPPPHIGVAYKHVHPSRHVGGRLDDVHAQLTRIAATFGMTSGPLYVQSIAAEDGITVIEAAARVGGGHESSLFRILCDGGVEDRLIDLALEGTCEPFGYDMRAVADPVPASVTFVLGRSGVVQRTPSLDDLPQGVVEAGWYVQPGDRLGDVHDSLGRIGYFVTVADTPAELARRSSEFYASLEVRSDTGENLVLQPEAAYIND